MNATKHANSKPDISLINKPLKQNKYMNNNSIFKKVVTRTLFSLLIICLFVPFLIAENANGQALKENNISYNTKNTSIVNVFNQLSKITGYYFFYNEEVIKNVKNISINVKNTEIDKVLNELSRQTNLSFKIIDNTISVSKKGQINTPSIVPQQKGGITGVVKDKNGEPIIGANVVVKGTSNGTITDLDGKFTLETSVGTILTVSYIGYHPKEFTCGAEGLNNITLLEDTQKLDEVVVVGYGVQKKANLTGAVSVVNMDKVLGDRPVTNVMSALQGTMPGLVISGGSKPGQSKTFNIRGTTSLNGGEPLVLVDNVPAQIDLINPEDIESVSILKDAASSAIYGARAAFGVILITTKKAKKGEKIQLNYTNNFGFQNSINRPQQAGALDMLQAYKDAGFLGGKYFASQDVDLWMKYITEYRQDPSKFDVTENGIYIPTENNPNNVRYYLHENDLYKNILDSYGFQQTHNVSAMGGGESISYRISLGYTNDQGILITDKDSYKRISASSYVSADITKWLNQSLDIRYAKGTKTMPFDGAESNIYALRLANLNPEGMMDYQGEMLPINTPKNYILYTDPMNTEDENPRFFSRTSIKPIKGLEVAFEYTFDKNIHNQKKYNSPFYYTSIQTNKSLTYPASQYWVNKESTDYNAINAYATYSLSLKDKHNFKAMTGYNQESRAWEALDVNRKDMINEDMPSISGSTGETVATDSFEDYTIRSGFFRLNYDYLGKYLVEVNGRYDGSSKFPKSNRFGFFPSFSLGWQLAQEKFMNWSDSWLDELKIRGSWGQIGNQAINPYAYTPIMDSFRPEWVVNGTLPTSLKAPGLVRNNFTWETVETLDFGFDASLFNYRLQATFDWYQRDTKDMLAPGFEFPSVVGTSAPLQNTADLRTKGWEISISWRDKIGELGYNIGLNLYDSRTNVTKYRNEVGLFYDRNSAQTAKRYREGMEIGEIWGYESDGYYTVDDFVNTTSWALKEGVTSIKGVQVRPGDVKFKNIKDDAASINQIDNGDDTTNNPGDRKIIGNSTPHYQFGATAGLNWKGFDLSIILQGVGKCDAWISDDLRWAFNSGQFGTIFDNQLDFWKPKDPNNGDWTAINPNAQWHRIYGEKGNSGSNQRIQTKYLLDASYLRLKNITLGYSIPKSLISKISITNAKVFCSTENLATWTSLPKGYDPERLNWQYPFFRTISFGVNITL